MTRPQRGRRPGGPDTRGAILEAARATLAARGFAGTSVRGVAAAAGVDAALVHHYFGSKEDLFLAAVEAPIDPRSVLREVFAGGLDGAGARLVTAVLTAYDEPAAQQRLLALLRSSIDGPGEQLVRDGFVRMVLQGLRGLVPDDRAEARASLVASQVGGLVLARYLFRLEPLASLPPAEVAAYVGPTVQRYLDGPLGPAEEPSGS